MATCQIPQEQEGTSGGNRVTTFPISAPSSLNPISFGLAFYGVSKVRSWGYRFGIFLDPRFGLMHTNQFRSTLLIPKFEIGEFAGHNFGQSFGVTTDGAPDKDIPDRLVVAHGMHAKHEGLVKELEALLPLCGFGLIGLLQGEDELGGVSVDVGSQVCGGFIVADELDTRFDGTNVLCAPATASAQSPNSFGLGGILAVNEFDIGQVAFGVKERGIFLCKVDELGLCFGRVVDKHVRCEGGPGECLCLSGEDEFVRHSGRPIFLVLGSIHGADVKRW
jgi:hypothetical protein